MCFHPDLHPSSLCSYLPPGGSHTGFVCTFDGHLSCLKEAAERRSHVLHLSSPVCGDSVGPNVEKTNNSSSFPVMGAERETADGEMFRQLLRGRAFLTLYQCANTHTHTHMHMSIWIPPHTNIGRKKNTGLGS